MHRMRMEKIVQFDTRRISDKAKDNELKGTVIGGGTGNRIDDKAAARA